jgi:hypothetical protein
MKALQINFNISLANSEAVARDMTLDQMIKKIIIVVNLMKKTIMLDNFPLQKQLNHLNKWLSR